MAGWSISAVAYGLVIAAAALAGRGGPRTAVAARALAFTTLAAVAGAVPPFTAVVLLAPGLLLILGYWLPGRLYSAPQPQVEDWLIRIDRRVGADRWARRWPRTMVGALEIVYGSASLVVGGGAIHAAIAGGTAATGRYWSVVLTAALASYVTLPWIQTRPPRALEGETVMAASATRRWNLAVLARAGVGANTLPSGHVSSTLAAALVTLAVSPPAGGGLLVVAVAIAIAAVAGRYHYLVDGVAGAMVAVVAWLVFG